MTSHNIGINPSAGPEQSCARPLLISMYFHPEPAGSAPPISDLALWISENDQSPEVITARPSYPQRVVYSEYRDGSKDFEIWRGVTVRRLKGYVSRNSGIAGRLATEASFLLSLLLHRLKSRRRAAVVISVCPSIFAVLGASFFRKKGGRHLAIVHDIQSGLGGSTGQAKSLMKILARVERFVLNRVDKIVTLTEGMKASLEENGIRTPILVYPPQINTAAISYRKDPNQRIAMYSGALGKKQGLRQILKSAQILQERGSDIRFVIRGQGGILPELKEISAALSLSNVSFEPLAPEHGYQDAMALGSVHLVPQSAAGANFALPSKVYSIMACARPMVATACPDSPLGNLFKESRAGLIVPPDRPEDFADAVERLMNAPDLRHELGQNGRDYAVANADRELVCKRIWRAADVDWTEEEMRFDLPSGIL